MSDSGWFFTFLIIIFILFAGDPDIADSIIFLLSSGKLY